MNLSLLRTGGIIAAFIVGYFLPQLHSLEWMIRWMVMLMLFITFLRVKFNRLRIQRQHVYLIAANLALAVGSWELMRLIGHPELSVMAFSIAVTPTATAAPVIMGFLKGNVEFMVTALITSTLTIGCLLPLLMPAMIGHSAAGLTLDMAKSIALILGGPLVAALIVRRSGALVQKWAGKLNSFQFPIWVLTLLLIAGSGSEFVRQHTEINSFVFLKMAILAAGLCAANFLVGYQLGRPSLKRECSQSLGQKNTTLTIYLAMTYASPLAALSVTFYVVFHNLWNAIQIQMQGHKENLDRKRIGEEEAAALSEEN